MFCLFDNFSHQWANDSISQYMIKFTSFIFGNGTFIRKDGESIRLYPALILDSVVQVCCSKGFCTTENVVNHPLKGGGCPVESKRKDPEMEVTKQSFESCVLLTVCT